MRNTNGPLRKPFPPSGLHQLLLQMETLDPLDTSPSWTNPLADYDPMPEQCTAPRSEQKQRDKTRSHTCAETAHRHSEREPGRDRHRHFVSVGTGRNEEP